MKNMTMGDYYVWYCEWCDSRNLTPWARTVGGKVCCGGCHKEFAVPGARVNEVGSQHIHQAHL